jgi:hypothetical protein
MSGLFARAACASFVDPVISTPLNAQKTDSALSATIGRNTPGWAEFTMTIYPPSQVAIQLIFDTGAEAIGIKTADVATPIVASRRPGRRARQLLPISRPVSELD